jgi:hypothetical protein
MGDLFSNNRQIFIKKHERDKIRAQAQILDREIRISELHEEIERCNQDIAGQRKIIAEQDKNIQLQINEIEKEKAAASAQQAK